MNKRTVEALRQFQAHLQAIDAWPRETLNRWNEELKTIARTLLEAMMSERGRARDDDLVSMLRDEIIPKLERNGTFRISPEWLTRATRLLGPKIETRPSAARKYVGDLDPAADYGRTRAPWKDVGPRLDLKVNEKTIEQRCRREYEQGRCSEFAFLRDVWMRAGFLPERALDAVVAIRKPPMPANARR